MRFAYFNEQGRVDTAHNDDTIHELPAGAIELTLQQWDSRFNLLLQNDELIDSPLAPAVPSVPELVADQLIEVNNACETSMSAIKAGYPESEVLSWPKQEEEARAWTADNAAATPLLDALATARGITKADLAARVIEKADLFAQISGQTIGKRQGLEDQLNALLDQFNNGGTVTQADIEAIAW